MTIDFKGFECCVVLGQKIAGAGHWIRYVDNVRQVSDAAAIQAIIDAHTVAASAAPLIAAVKQEARARILAFLPDWKQSNYNARMNELNDARFSRALTGDEEDEITVMRAAWSRAVDIRQASDEHEVAIAALTTFAQVTAYDIKANWPE